jgi:hypothetical protein
MRRVFVLAVGACCATGAALADSGGGTDDAQALKEAFAVTYTVHDWRYDLDLTVEGCVGALTIARQSLNPTSTWRSSTDTYHFDLAAITTKPDAVAVAMNANRGAELVWTIDAKAKIQEDDQTLLQSILRHVYSKAHDNSEHRAVRDLVAGGLAGPHFQTNYMESSVVREASETYWFRPINSVVIQAPAEALADRNGAMIAALDSYAETHCRP